MEKQFIRFATATAKFAGKPWTFIGCLAIVLVWALSGPIFRFSATWQLVINTGTTVITFLMVFLIQNTQNRDGAAMHAKLDELIHAIRNADEGFVGIEHLTEKDLDTILSRVEERAGRIHGDAGGALPVVATRAEDEARAARRSRKTVARKVRS
ncbi:MAG: low affinity iron permease family protein [Brevundimonas sp.]|uniref:low affinity iron permease family protein n=1 Tax=Brevundimonas sp. TaxID=1871086 RepID=UPI0027276EF6|nr:low affinity iron permease family protein [Brevundimonas sp.]MDO9589182.1 low affinity iron permease family protein [Brevundimonas sp.]MDP3370425.1 low affinity iron permease family protein [Brevundimonas sp.]MDP3656336.1 low affinity iron permease family protein [Brevundimonas sp.]MDZ4112702.1 low affinity iron permease family protein [Brevundimonas sp.]